jgi:hypothetical protein
MIEMIEMIVRRVLDFGMASNRILRDVEFSSSLRTGSKKRGCLHDHLLASKQRVADELASPEGNGSVGHFGGVVMMQRVECVEVHDFQFSCGLLG